LAGPRFPILEKQRDSPCQNGRLARAGSGDDEESRTSVNDSIPLLRVKPFQQRIGGIDGEE